MALEIRELVIKASVNDVEQQYQTNQKQVESSTQMGDRSEIIAACVEQVLAILKERLER